MEILVSYNDMQTAKTVFALGEIKFKCNFCGKVHENSKIESSSKGLFCLEAVKRAILVKIYKDSNYLRLRGLDGTLLERIRRYWTCYLLNNIVDLKLENLKSFLIDLLDNRLNSSPIYRNTKELLLEIYRHNNKYLNLFEELDYLGVYVLALEGGFDFIYQEYIESLSNETKALFEID